MGEDDDADCAGHVWRLQGVALSRSGAQSDYSCVRCGAALLVPEGGVHPDTV